MEVVTDVRASSLDEMGGKTTAMPFVLRAGQVLRQVGEIGIEKAQKGAECLFLAAVRRCRDHDEMPGPVGDELFE